MSIAARSTDDDAQPLVKPKISQPAATRVLVAHVSGEAEEDVAGLIASETNKAFMTSRHYDSDGNNTRRLLLLGCLDGPSY